MTVRIGVCSICTFHFLCVVSNDAPLYLTEFLQGHGPQPAFARFKQPVLSSAIVDFGSTMHVAAVNIEANDMPVHAFGTFNQDMHNLPDWCKSSGVTKLATESTGAYRMPVFEVREGHVFDVILVNALHAKNMPRRKTDVSDAGWLRQSQSYGLLWGSFRPEAEIAILTLCFNFSAIIHLVH